MSALLGATDRDRRDEPARHALGALVDVGHEHGEFLGHRAGERRLHRDAERPVLRVGERRQVERLERAILRHDAAGRGRLGRDIHVDRELLDHGVGEIAGPGRGEGELRLALGLDLRGPGDHHRLAGLHGDVLRERPAHVHALGLERDVDVRVGLRGVAHERAEVDGVADAEHPRQRRPDEQRLRREELVQPFADHRVAGDRARLHPPRREVVGHAHLDAGRAVVLGHESRPQQIRFDDLRCRRPWSRAARSSTRCCGSPGASAAGRGRFRPSPVWGARR